MQTIQTTETVKLNLIINRLIVEKIGLYSFILMMNIIISITAAGERRADIYEIQEQVFFTLKLKNCDLIK